MLFNINNLQKIYCEFKSMNLSFIAIFTICFQSFSSLEAKIIEKDSVIKIVFVTNRNGIQLKQKADTNSTATYSVQFGDRLEVIQK